MKNAESGLGAIRKRAAPPPQFEYDLATTGHCAASVAFSRYRPMMRNSCDGRCYEKSARGGRNKSHRKVRSTNSSSVYGLSETPTSTIVGIRRFLCARTNFYWSKCTEPPRRATLRLPRQSGISARGVQMTSLMREAPSASITRRSKPIATPLASGMAWSAARKSSSSG